MTGLVSVSVRTVAATVAVLPLLLVLACGDSEEVTPAPSSTASATTVAPSPATPTPSLADWPTYTDPGRLFTIRYPLGWFQGNGQPQFSSYDLSTLTTTQRPPNALTVEVSYSPAVGLSDCGGLTVDPKSGEGSPGPSATVTSLGGEPAWQVIKTKGDPALEENITRTQSISLIHAGYCLVLIGIFTQEVPDTDTFLQIASSFNLTF